MRSYAAGLVRGVTVTQRWPPSTSADHLTPRPARWLATDRRPDELGGDGVEDVMVSQHRVAAAAHRDVADPCCSRDVTSDGGGVRRAGDAVLVPMDDEHVTTRRVEPSLVRMEPGREGDRRTDLRQAAGQQRCPAAEANQRDGKVRPEASRGLIDGPCDVTEWRVLAVPSPEGVEQTLNGEVASGMCDARGNWDHAQDRQLRRAHAHGIAPRSSAMEHEHDALHSCGDLGVDEPRRRLHQQPTGERFFAVVTRMPYPIDVRTLSLDSVPGWDPAIRQDRRRSPSAMPPSAGDVAAVDVELEAGHELRVIAREGRQTAAAMSSGWPRWPIGVRSTMVFQYSVPFVGSRIGVSMKPGWTELTRIPSVAQQRGVLRQGADRALGCVVAERVPKPPLVPKIELMFTIEACSDFLRCGAATFMPRNTPVWSMATVRFHSSSVVSSIVLRSPMPALLTTMSRPPNASTALAHAASIGLARHVMLEERCAGGRRP